MSSSRPLLSKWCFEYMSPVVVTTSSAEVENTCLKNGLLFHELLSAFGHLDGIHASVRSAHQAIQINDAHVRFERITEVQPKSAGCVEEALRLSFKEFDMNKLPVDFEELKSAPPSGWTHNIEQRIIRSSSFSEYEMISQPLCILTVVSTADVDPVANMQELCSAHHSPSGFKTGQYDPDVQRVYMILHDNSAGLSVDTALLLRQMKSKFSPTRTKLLCINSLPEGGQNLQQPDIWTRWKIPMFFPQHAPMMDPAEVRPINPSTNEAAIGARLSMEDFMSLRNFCIEIYQQDLLPQLERRIGYLTRIVNDTKKGMKNVIKNFWRKPREESVHDKGSVRYRYDRVESQILLLSDTAFSLKDYDFAMTHYKLVRDDFKADKSVLHVVHCCIMIAVCQFLMDPMSGRGRDLIGYLEAVKECLPSIQDSGHMVAYYSVLLSELYTAVPGNRYPLEAAAVLLQASAAVSRLGLLSALLSERAALYCIQAGQCRKYSFHHVLAGNKFYAVGNRAMRHAMVCYSCVLLLHESGNWSGVKSKLFRILADELKSAGNKNSRRAVLFMLRVVNFLTQDTGTLNPLALADSVSVLYELMEGKHFGNVEIMREWRELKTRQILLGDIPVIDRSVVGAPEDSLKRQQTMNLMKISSDESEATPAVTSSNELLGSDSQAAAAARTAALVHDIPVPTIVLQTVCFLEPVNGTATLKPFENLPSDNAERMRSFLSMEQEWIKAYAAGNRKLTFAESWVKMEETLATSLTSRKAFSARKSLLVPFGESITLRLELSNRFPVELILKKLQLVLDDNSLFDVQSVEVILQGCESRVVLLTAKPKRLGSFQVVGATWLLSDSLQICQPLERPGPKLQKTLSQRINGIRGKDESLCFDVVAEHPLLRVELSGIKGNVIQGELTRVAVSLLNEGPIAAGNIVIKLSLPCIVFEEEGLLDFLGEQQTQWEASETGKPFPALCGTSTVFVLPPQCIIPPGTELKFYGWMKMDSVGHHNLSVTASYYAVRLTGDLQPLGPSGLTRTSTAASQVFVEPSVNFRVSCHSNLGTAKKMIQLETKSMLSRQGIEGSVESPEKVICENVLTSKWDWELNEYEIRIECLWILGAAEACEHTAIASAHPTNEENENIIRGRGTRTMNSPRLAPGDTYCTGVGINVVKPNEQGIKHVSDSGSVESSNLFWGENSQREVAQEWRKVMDRFLCLSDSNFRFQAALEEAREKLRSETESMADAQPRSISQVRKDNNENKQREVADLKQLDNLPASTSVQGISDQGVLAGEAVVAIGWVANVGGILKRGIHVTDALPVLDAVPSRPSAVASDFLQVQILQDRTERINLRKGETAIIPVSLVLVSTCSTALSVDVEALDTFSLKRYNTTSANSSGAVQQGSSVNTGTTASSELFSPNVPLKGVRWEGKLRHKNILLDAFGTITLKFIASVSRPGVFDLKNFHITVGFPDSNGANEARKTVVGQSLVYVAEAQ